MTTAIQHTTLPTNGITLHVAQAGPPDGPPLILLHGFPEYWGGWAKQIPALAAAGHRVWAPDQRGYNLSSKPAGVRAYAIDELARDVLGLIDTIRTANVPAIFTDTTASSATAEQIASEAGVHIVPLYTGSLSQPGEGADTYLDYMRYNTAAIVDALR